MEQINSQQPSLVVSLQDVVKRQADEVILKGIGVDVYQGEFVAITGPSGSGKSTILRIMQGIEQPDEGSAHLLGHNITDMPHDDVQDLIRRSVGIGFQSAPLDGNYSVCDNVKLAAEGKELTVTNQYLAELAINFGLGNKLFKKSSKLSGGEQMRVSLMRTIVTRPEVILLDEPTAPLDTVMSSRVLEIFRAMVDTLGTTIVMVTHDGDVAQRYIDREVVIDSGQVASNRPVLSARSRESQSIIIPSV